MADEANNLSRQELDERIAILKRFRSLLEQQRENFRNYLKVLEKQQSKIESDDSDSTYEHTKISEKIISDIMCLQKVIVPLQPLYENGKPSEAIEQLKDNLEDLRQKAVLQNKLNQNLLQTNITQTRAQMSSFASKNPYRGRRSIYADRQVGNTLSLEG